MKATPYDGLSELLRSLKREGYLVGVATLKREDYALTLLEHYQISNYCDCICGSDFASKMQKTDVLDKCLKGLNLSPGEAVLIGDTASDGSAQNAPELILLQSPTASAPPTLMAGKSLSLFLSPVNRLTLVCFWAWRRKSERSHYEGNKIT